MSLAEPRRLLVGFAVTCWLTLPIGVDGEDAFVYESDSLNESAFDGNRTVTGFDQEDVQSVDGRVVISPDGRIHSVTVDIRTQAGRYGTNTTIQYGDTTISQPSWVDESEAP